MTKFILQIENTSADELSVGVLKHPDHDPVALTEILYSASCQLNDQHPELLRSFFFAALQVLKENNEVMQVLDDLIAVEKMMVG